MFKIFWFFLYLIKGIVSIFWRLIWGLTKTVLILGLLAVALLYYTRHHQSSFTDQINQGVRNIHQLVERTIGKSSSDHKLLTTDQHTTFSGARWAQPRATIFIATTHPTFYQAYEEAIEQWNATGVFTFTLVANQQQANIIASDYSDSTSEAAGLANTQVNSLTNELIKAEVLLNHYFLGNANYGYSYERIVNTAIHELGHAIGLPHDDENISVMQSSGSFYSIQPIDIVAVQRLYQTT